LQRKPSERLGLRGAAEVKDHPWIKYYPWKDLYEKKIESGFIPKNTDNWDKKYCEAPDKIGLETKERYENFLRMESTHEVFKDYDYFGYEDMNNKDQKLNRVGTNTKYYNPHINVSNTPVTQQEQPQLDISSNSVNVIKMRGLEKTPSMDLRSNINKKISMSSSNSSLLKQQHKHQMSNVSMNSTGSGNSNGSASLEKQRSGSMANLGNK
jgi:hypothetical protein